MVALLLCYCKYTNKRARNIKFTWIFFTASAVYIRGLPQIYEQTSEKYQVYLDIFQSKCSIYSRFTSNIVTNEREISSLLGYFSQRQRENSVVCDANAKKALVATKGGLPPPRSVL